MTEYAYTQNDNEIIVEFQEDGSVKDMSTVSKIAIELFAAKSDPVQRNNPIATFDTVANPTLFDTTNLANGRLTFKPDSSALSGLTGSTYYGRCVVFSSTYPNGLVWAKSHEDLFTFVISR